MGPESKIELYLRQRCRALGALCYKTTSPGHRGFPDRYVVPVSGGPAPFFVEVKSAIGKVTPLQDSVHRELRLRDVIVYVVRSRGDVDDLPL